MGKECYVVVDKERNLAHLMIDYIEENSIKNYYISPQEGLSKMNEETLLIITDTHNPDLVESKELLEKASCLAVIDHHRLMVKAIEKSDLFYHEPSASSASEMVAELVQYMGAHCISRLEAEALDITVPGKAHKLGHKHPMYLALDEIKDIFNGMGFTVLDGPEVELAEYNFDKLNAEEGHPSRDWSDTFYFDEDSRVMLRSQTSPMQVRAMETMELPIRIIAPGRVYRKDEVDATHSPMFHQVEGMVIDKGVTMADLKGTLNTVVEQLYGKGTRPGYVQPPYPYPGHTWGREWR